MATKETATAASDEGGGARGFGVVLAKLEGGAFHGELSEEVHALLTKLARHAEHFGRAKGEVHVAIKFDVDDDGVVDVRTELKLKEPKVVRPRTVFWLNKACNLESENPRQTALPLREVPKPEAPRDVTLERRPERSV